MPDVEDYRRALQTRFHRAARRGSAHEIVSARALYVEAGAKESQHQMPSCCSIMLRGRLRANYKRREVAEVWQRSAHGPRHEVSRVAPRTTCNLSVAPSTA